MDLSLSLNEPILVEEQSELDIDWEHWGKEPTVELCEVKLGFDGFHMSASFSNTSTLSCSLNHFFRYLRRHPATDTARFSATY